ncbi:MAG: 7-cyano-7-deazaguanine synthase QueC [Spirochaetes bacterium]|nr:7-cyano-7-deazaguanine synthase QueC [Spirochaetota bacterium]
MAGDRAVVLLSGGLDSATTIAVAVHERYEILAMTFAYGQRHGVELSRAKELARDFGAVEHAVVDIPPGLFAGSALTGAVPEAVPKNRRPEDGGDIPVTYVPARNILFLSYALAFAESRGAGAVYIGANAVDYSGYPDCRGEFLDAFERMAALGMKCGVEGRPVKILAPLLNLRKSEIIRLGIGLGVDYSKTHSCYDPDSAGLACGDCDSCRIRIKGFAEAGVPDPTRYRTVP